MTVVRIAAACSCRSPMLDRDDDAGETRCAHCGRRVERDRHRSQAMPVQLVLDLRTYVVERRPC